MGAPSIAGGSGRGIELSKDTTRSEICMLYENDRDDARARASPRMAAKPIRSLTPNRCTVAQRHARTCAPVVLRSNLFRCQTAEAGTHSRRSWRQRMSR